MSEKLYTVVVHREDGAVCCMDMRPVARLKEAEGIATIMQLAFPMNAYKVYELKEVKE